MFVRIQNLLSEEDLQAVDSVLADAAWVDGAETAGPAARQVKSNLQMDPKSTPEAGRAMQTVTDAIRRNARIGRAAVPNKVGAPLFSRYDVGMSYGLHTDNPFMGGGNISMRTDMSLTIFLSDPDSYQGGELVANADIGPVRFKLPKGDGLLYPTGTMHQVAEVTEGFRLAAVTWIQSRIADPHRRQLVAEMDRLVSGVARNLPEDSTEVRLARKLQGDLVRLWSEG